jgi:hypothetical protein
MLRIKVETCLKTIRDKGPGWERADRRYFSRYFDIPAPELEKYLNDKTHSMCASNLGEVVESKKIILAKLVLL